MAKKRDRQQRKADKRALELHQRALRQGDAVTLLETSRAEAGADDAALASTFIHDVVTSFRRKDHTRLLRLAQAFVQGGGERLALDGVDREGAIACRWALLRPCLAQGLVAPAGGLVAALAPAIRGRAPALLTWLEAWVEHGGAIPVGVVQTLPELPAELASSAPAWRFPAELADPEAFGQAVLAGTVLLKPSDLSDAILRHLGQIEPGVRAAHAKAALPGVRLRALEAAAAGDRTALRASLGLWAALCGHHLDVGALAFALRLIRNLDANRHVEDLRCVARLVELAWSVPELRPMALAAFEGLGPERRLVEVALALGRRLLEQAGPARVWLHAFKLWHEQVGEEPNDDAPAWLADAYERLVAEGEFATQCLSLDPNGRRRLLGELDVFDWRPFLDLIEQLWDRLPGLEHGVLATLAADCLVQARESSGPPARTARELRRRIQEFIIDEGPAAPGGAFELLARLRELPPDELLPRELAEGIAALIQGDEVTIGPRKRAFIDRMAERVVPHSRDFLHLVLCSAGEWVDGARWVDLHLGDEPTTGELLAVAELVWDHTWPVLDTEIERRLEERAARSSADLCELFEALVWDLEGPPPLVERLARAIVEAHDRGDPGVTWRALAAAGRIAKPRRRGKGRGTSKSPAKGATKKATGKAATKTTNSGARAQAKTKAKTKAKTRGTKGTGDQDGTAGAQAKAPGEVEPVAKTRATGGPAKAAGEVEPVAKTRATGGPAKAAGEVEPVAKNRAGGARGIAPGEVEPAAKARAEGPQGASRGDKGRAKRGEPQQVLPGLFSEESTP